MDLLERLRETATERKAATALDEPGHYLNVVARISREDGALMDQVADLIEAQAAQLQEAREAAECALRYIENSEAEWGAEYEGGKALRAFLAKSQ
jgi:formate dehydrogenase maturation protein FdhE